MSAVSTMDCAPASVVANVIVVVCHDFINEVVVVVSSLSLRNRCAVGNNKLSPNKINQ
jgi:hypothetical protein